MSQYKKLLIKNIGIYNCKISKDFQLKVDRTKEDLGVIITIGGVGKACVQVNVPYQGTNAHLMWIEAAFGCALSDVEQRGDLLIQMTNAAIHIAKTYNPGLQMINLQDSSSFTCKLPNGSNAPINSTLHDLAFYQESYYEKRYKAILTDASQRDEYYKRKGGFLNAAKKPMRFIFGPPDLQEELEPLYLESSTWKEFFDTIRIRYDKEKCTVIAMWLVRAVADAMDFNYSGQLWTIDFNNVDAPDFELVDYTEQNHATYEKYGLKKYLSRGGRTRKALRKKESNWREMYEMDWKSYFEKEY
jgi:hypothetical protein